MAIFTRRRVNIVAEFDCVRVTVKPRPTWLEGFLLAAALIIVGAVYQTVPRSTPESGWSLLLTASVVAIIVYSWCYQLFGCEIIQVNAETIVITKQLLQWRHRREYPIAQCSDLEWRTGDGEGSTWGMQCKAGSQTVRFGDYVSEGEAVEIFTALQSTLPLAAQQLSATTKPKPGVLTTGYKRISDICRSKAQPSETETSPTGSAPGRGPRPGTAAAG